MLAQVGPRSLYSVSTLLLAAGLTLVAGSVIAQGDDAAGAGGAATAEQRVQIQPYTGPPIFLDEREVIAAPTIVNREIITDKFDGGTGGVWIERQVARFSDDHFEADGIYREYYPNGKPFIEGQFRRGRQHGEWSYWYDNGQLNRKLNYVNGQPDGEWDMFRADGTLAAKRGFREGRRHGKWITYDSTGEQPLREESYDNGKADGDWKVWFADGKLQRQVGFKQGEKHGLSVEWSDEGEKLGEVPYVDGKLHGTVTMRTRDGRNVVQEYDTGKLVSEKK